MQAFAQLLDRLSTAPGRNARLDLIAGYLKTAPDPDRGFALAALSGDLSLRSAKPAMIRELAASRADPDLFGMSYDYVGDLAETVALIWPTELGANATPRLSEIIDELDSAKRAQVPDLVAGWLDRLDAHLEGFEAPRLQGRAAILRALVESMVGGWEDEATTRNALDRLRESGVRDTWLALGLNNLGEVEFEQRDDVSAELHYTQAQEIWNDVRGSSPPNTAVVRRQPGQIA